MSVNIPIERDGDAGFIGFASRPDPVTLPAGVCSLARNKRFVRGRAETRKGLKRLADDINAGQVPLTLPFALAVDKTITSLTESAGTATATVSTHGYTSGQTINIRGADQTEYNGDFNISVVDPDTFTYPVAGGPASPATGTILANGGPVVRTTYLGGLFAACVFRSPLFDAGTEWIGMAGSDALWLWREGQSAQSKGFPGSETIEETDRVKLLQAFDRLYVLREAPMTGLYARRAVTSITESAGTATVTMTAHGFSNGMRVRIEGAEQAAYLQEFDITVTAPDTFTFAVSHSPTSPATGTITARRVKAPMYWDGASSSLTLATGGSNAAGATFSRMFSTSVAAYFNNQIVLAPSPARDTVAISDVLDPDTYDPLLKSFRANAGSSDFIVALHPYAESDILVFMRKSIYRARIVVASNGVDIDPAESFIELLTDEVGCAARDSVVTAGQFIFFLSDAGVYRLDSNFSDLKLRGMTLPLSDEIADQFETVNAAAVHTANAAWFDNRYWLAVPTNGQEYPNSIFVWNALNEKWESVDNFPTGIHTLAVSNYGNRRRLFGVTRAGRLFLMEERADGDDPNDPAVTAVVQIAGEMVTRRYQYGVNLPKRFMRCVNSLVVEGGAGVRVSARFMDPDSEQVLGTFSNAASVAEDVSQKLSIRRQAAAVELVFQDVAGRTTVRTVAVEAVAGDPRMTTLTKQ
jgi:hypothetical protein